MKYALVALLTLAGSLAAAAEKTPYQVLEENWGKGTPTRLAEIPTIEECAAGTKHLLSLDAAVGLSTTQRRLSVLKNRLGNPLYFVKISNITGVVEAAVPSRGPLFPAIPEKDLTIPLVLTSYPCTADVKNRVDPYTDPSVFNELVHKHYEVKETDLALTISISDGISQGLFVLKTYNGAIIAKESVTAGYSSATYFSYYWPE